MPSHGYLRHPPKQLQPWELIALAHDAGIVDPLELITAGQIALAESQGYPGAFNDNFSADIPADVLHLAVWTPEGGYDEDVAARQRPYLKQRDCGLWEIYVTPAQVGTDAEHKLYDPATNAKAMVVKHRDSGWKPWAAFTEDVYLNRSYVRRAVRGYGNWLHRQVAERQRHAGKDDQVDAPPMLAFMWWVNEMVLDLQEVRAQVKVARKAASSPVTIAALTEIDKAAARAINVPKQGALP